MPPPMRPAWRFPRRACGWWAPPRNVSSSATATSLSSQPIKGTAPRPELLSAKDRAENVMICDLVRNDLGRVCQPGTVEVPHLLALEHHPGLVHLVTTVTGRLRAGVSWPQLIDALFPPGSVTGAPKLAALATIDDLEPTPRGPYCGALGWVDGDEDAADLAVSIRTFWAASDTATDTDAGAGSAATAQGSGSPGAAWRWTFGTGGAITWDSDATDEWDETELKSARLLQVAAEPLRRIGPRLAPEATPRAW